DFWTSRMTAIKVLGEYVGLLLWPARLSADYSYNQIPLFAGNLARWEDGKALIALVGLLAAAGFWIMAYRRRKILFFAIGFFFASIAPMANLAIVIGTIMGERFLYLPAVGFVLAVVWAAREYAGARAVKIAAAVVLLALVART